MLKVNIRTLTLALMLTVTPLANAQDEVLAKATALIKAHDYKTAYVLLEPLEGERSGDVEYDYLLGVSGVESGNVTRGVFALERVLAIQPNNNNARAEIAKAHFKLGEVDSSKTEFKNLLDQKPPQETTEAINRYMNAIDKSLGLTTTFAAYLDFGLGHDTNVNSATTSSTIAVPVFGGAIFSLNPLSRERSDNFTSLAGGVSFRQPINNQVAVFSALNLNNRFNANQSTFDTTYLDFNGGLSYKKFTDTFSAALQASTFEVDSNRFRNAYGFTGQWQRDLDDHNQVNLFGQYARISYASNSFRDADRYVAGGGWAHVFEGDKSPVLFLSGYGGQENARNSGADFLSNCILGARAGGQLSLNTKWVAYATSSYEYRDYDDADPIFLRSRLDKQYDVSVGLRYLPGYNWVIRPQISYLKNDSNIVINDYDRTVISVNFRHDFNW